jgi:hypothetical protein
MRRLLLIAACAVSLGSCATFLRPPEGGEAARLAERINSGGADALAGQSSLPFLVDQEIVQIKGDVAAFWKAVKESGIRLAGTSDAVLNAGPEAYRAFADTFEMKAFFKKYVPPGARIVSLATQAGKRVLLIIADEMFASRIYGFKGPF